MAVLFSTSGASPGSVGHRMRLALGSGHHDLATRALVMGVARPPDELVAQGAEILEIDGPCWPPVAAGVAVCVPASDEAAVERAVTGGADLVRMSQPTTASLRLCAAAGVAVLVPVATAGAAAAAGLPIERIVVESLVVDMTADACPVAATAVGVIRGARIVRTADVQGARRICDVLAAVLEAR